MALTTGVKVTNRTSSVTKSATLLDLTEASNYSIREDSDAKQDTVKMENLTQPLMYGEISSRWFKKTKGYNTPLSAQVNTPATEMRNVGVQVDTIVVTDDDANPMTGEVRDVVQSKVQVAWTDSPYITKAIIQQQLMAAISQYFDETAGNSRLDDWMRGNINPRNEIA